MFYEICAAIALVIFAILAYYIYCTLKRVTHTLRHVDRLSEEISFKMQQLDSTFKSLSNVGDIASEETLRFKEQYLFKQLYESKYAHRESDTDSSDDLVNLLL